MRARIIFYPEVGSVLGRMLQADEGLKFQQFAHRTKIDQRQAVAERIVNPSDFRRLGNDVETAFQQSLIEAVARAEQELMQARSYRSFVAIHRLMMYREHRHDGTTEKKNSTVAQIGYLFLVFPLATGASSAIGWSAGLMQILAHAFAKA